MKRQACKICFVCYRRFPDTNFENYSKAVLDNGYDVSVISYLDQDQKSFELAGKRKIFRIRLPEKKSPRYKLLYFVIKVVQHLNKNEYQLVHIHHTCFYFILIKFLTFRRFKFIFHITSYPIQNIRYKSIQRMIVMYLQCIFMDKIIVQSQELKEKLIGIRNLKKAVIVPIGYNKDVFYQMCSAEIETQKEKLGFDSNEIILVYCGTIDKYRQLERLLEASAIISERIVNLRLLMIGDGNAVQGLKRTSKKLGIEQNVIFVGRIPHAKLINYFASADIGISYIPINENYNYNPPLKTFEYLAAGMLTVATATVSNCRIIRNNYNGILVEDNPKKIADALLRLIGNKELQAKLKSNARKSISEFDFSKITNNKLIPIYVNLLKQ